MSDLISRSELIDYLDKERKQIPIDSEKYNIDSNVVDGMISALQAFEDKVKEVETAYDIDKVIEKLEEIREKKTCNKEKCDTKEICRICVVDDAIEIVKQGGVADDVCEPSADKIKVTSLEVIVTGSKRKPYYEIKYKEVGADHYNIGYSSYNLDFVLDWKEKCFELIKVVE